MLKAKGQPDKICRNKNGIVGVPPGGTSTPISMILNNVRMKRIMLIYSLEVSLGTGGLGTRKMTCLPSCSFRKSGVIL
jgi:hypothetical protein